MNARPTQAPLSFLPSFALIRELPQVMPNFTPLFQETAGGKPIQQKLPLILFSSFFSFFPSFLSHCFFFLYFLRAAGNLTCARRAASSGVSSSGYV